MDLGLTGKKALITGSTKGLGRGIAEALMAEGASVAICARNQEGVDAALAELKTKGTACGAAVDAGDPDSLRAWINASAEELGGIDIYVHNTSGKPGADLASWENNFKIDLMAMAYGIEAATPYLTQSDDGNVISIGTSAALEHFATGANGYSTFKAAVTHYGLGSAQTLGAQGIRSNVVSPGPIFVEGGDWDMIKQHMEDFYNATAAVHPAGKLGEVEDVANAVTYLASPRARHITGANLTVDGGFMKRVNY